MILLFKDGEFDDSQIPRTIRSFLDPLFLLIRRFKDARERCILAFDS